MDRADFHRSHCIGYDYSKRVSKHQVIAELKKKDKSLGTTHKEGAKLKPELPEKAGRVSDHSFSVGARE